MGIVEGGEALLGCATRVTFLADMQVQRADVTLSAVQHRTTDSAGRKWKQQQLTA